MSTASLSISAPNVAWHGLRRRELACASSIPAPADRQVVARLATWRALGAAAAAVIAVVVPTGWALPANEPLPAEGASTS